MDNILTPYIDIIVRVFQEYGYSMLALAIGFAACRTLIGIIKAMVTCPDDAYVVPHDNPEVEVAADDDDEDDAFSYWEVDEE